MEEPDVFEKFFDIEGYGADCAEALTTTPQVSVPELDDSLTPAGSSSAAHELRNRPSLSDISNMTPCPDSPRAIIERALHRYCDSLDRPATHEHDSQKNNEASRLPAPLTSVTSSAFSVVYGPMPGEAGPSSLSTYVPTAPATESNHGADTQAAQMTSVTPGAVESTSGTRRSTKRSLQSEDPDTADAIAEEEPTKRQRRDEDTIQQYVVLPEGPPPVIPCGIPGCGDTTTLSPARIARSREHHNAHYAGMNKSAKLIKCKWVGCAARPMEWVQLTRHFLADHLGARWRCPNADGANGVVCRGSKELDDPATWRRWDSFARHLDSRVDEKAMVKAQEKAAKQAQSGSSTQETSRSTRRSTRKSGRK